MIKFEIDAQKNILRFECEGEPSETAADAVVCIRKTYDAIKEVSEEDAGRFIAFIVNNLANPMSVFYEDVDWEDEGREDPKC